MHLREPTGSVFAIFVAGFAVVNTTTPLHTWHDQAVYRGVDSALQVEPVRIAECVIVCLLILSYTLAETIGKQTREEQNRTIKDTTTKNRTCHHVSACTMGS